MTWWTTGSLVKHTLPDTCACVGSACKFSVLRFRTVLVWCIVGAEIFLRPDRRSVSRELIISQHTARSQHQGCRGAQATKSSPYCAYSPHLRSLCCAVHSGPPVQLFSYKKLQNSILQREKNRDNGGYQNEAVKNKCNSTTTAEQKEAKLMKACSPHIAH